jgi:hypothetical protein
MLAILSAAGTGPLNTMGMVTRRDAAGKPEAWIGPERGNVEVKREDVHMRAARCIVPLSFRPLPTLDMRKGMRDRCRVDVESRGASRDSWSLPKPPVATHHNVHPPPPSTDRDHALGEDSANPVR